MHCACRSSLPLLVVSGGGGALALVIPLEGRLLFSREQEVAAGVVEVKRVPAKHLFVIWFNFGGGRARGTTK